MQKYKDWDHDSNIQAYELGHDFIKVLFKNGKYRLYTYTYLSAGSIAIEHMKCLAQNNDGLNSYISTEKPKYALKEICHINFLI